MVTSLASCHAALNSFRIFDTDWSSNSLRWIGYDGSRLHLDDFLKQAS